MKGKEAFAIWAPKESKWSAWVKPAGFLFSNSLDETKEVIHFDLPDVGYFDNLPPNAAIIVDLPEYLAINEGLALAKRGYQPVPLYNGTIAQRNSRALVNTQVIGKALIWAAIVLENTEISVNAPPAFLLDSNRLHRYKKDPTLFDNSWDVYDQDFPTARFFLNNGIKNIVVRGNTINKDIIKILYSMQKNKIVIHLCDSYRMTEVRIIKICELYKFHKRSTNNEKLG